MESPFQPLRPQVVRTVLCAALTRTNLHPSKGFQRSSHRETSRECHMIVGLSARGRPDTIMRFLPLSVS